MHNLIITFIGPKRIYIHIDGKLAIVVFSFLVVMNLILIFIITHLLISLFLFLLLFLLLKILKVPVILTLLLCLLSDPCLMTIEVLNEVWTIIVVLVNWAWVSLRAFFVFLGMHRDWRRSMLQVTPRLDRLTVYVIGNFIFVYILRGDLILIRVLVGTECLIIIVYLKVL